MDYDAEIARCERELAEHTALLRAGHPDVAGLCRAVADWAGELRLLQKEKAREPLKSDARAYITKVAGPGD